MRYRYIYYDNGVVILRASDLITQVQLNRITRFLFGRGASLNQVFNGGVAAFVKFQSYPNVNKQRAYLTTKVWRYCNSNSIPIDHENFPPRNIDGNCDADFNFFLDHINKKFPMATCQP